MSSDSEGDAQPYQAGIDELIEQAGAFEQDAQNALAAHFDNEDEYMAHLVEQDTQQALTSFVRQEVANEIAILRQNMKPEPKRQRTATHSPIAALGQDELCYMMSAHTQAARRLFAVAKPFAALAGPILRAAVPRVMIVGCSWHTPEDNDAIRHLGMFVEREEHVNGCPSYILTSLEFTHPASPAVLWISPGKDKWNFGPLYASGTSRFAALYEHAVRSNSLFHLQPLTASRPRDCPRDLSLTTTSPWKNKILVCGEISVSILDPSKWEGECKSAAGQVHLHGHLEGRHDVLGPYFKTSTERVNCYPLYAHKHAGWFMWHAGRHWWVGSSELIGQRRGRLCVVAHCFGPDDIKGTWEICVADGAFVESDVHCWSGRSFADKLSTAARQACPNIAVCGDTPGGVHQAALGKFRKVARRMAGRACYQNTSNDSVFLWHHDFAWTIGSVNDLGNAFGFLVCWDAALKPESIVNTWQLLDGSGLTDVPDVQVFHRA